MKRFAIFLSVTMISLASTAQPTEFPEGVAMLTPELFAAKVAGKSFSGVRADGADMRLDIDKDGALTWYARGNAERGKWRLDGDKFCGELGPRFGASCNEFRIGTDAIYYKRVTNGEVVTLRLR